MPNIFLNAVPLERQLSCKTTLADQFKSTARFIRRNQTGLIESCAVLKIQTSRMQIENLADDLSVTVELHMIEEISKAMPCPVVLVNTNISARS
jgi:hypothetical protein